MAAEHGDNRVTDAEVTTFAIREWLAAVADTDERRAVREMATAAMKEIGRLQRVERAAREWAENRELDASVTRTSVIPSAQRLLDALEN